MDRTDYECVLRFSVYRVSRMAQTLLALEHLTPQLARDLQLCLESMGATDILNYSASETAKRVVPVTLSPKQGTSRVEFNDMTIKLKDALGASWWE